MLSLWLSRDHRSAPWNIHNDTQALCKLFQQVRFPSTTVRLPRKLTDYVNFKASELRVLLLFGYVIFDGYLPEKYYKHLLTLVGLLHLAENRRISSRNITIMQQLGERFVVSFSQLYTERHCVPVVHSIVHLAMTVRDFGPLTSYTTFNFEDLLGELPKTYS